MQSTVWRWFWMAAIFLLLAGLYLLPVYGVEWLLVWTWLWIIMLLTAAALLFAFRPPAEPQAAPAAPPPLPPRPLQPDEVSPVLREVMDIRIATEDNGIQAYRGPLRDTPERTIEYLNRATGGQTVPLVQEDPQLGATVVLLPRPVEQRQMTRRSRPLTAWLLLAATLVTTTWAGARHQGVDLTADPSQFTVGLPYSLGLLAILGLHELGHYFVARYHRINVSPPYFVPVPFALGTFGAFIQMRSPTPDRRALFDVAVAGPLAGLVAAIPALMIGLQSSTLIAAEGEGHALSMHGTSVTSSTLFALLAKLSIGDALQYGHVLQLSPLAFAGWLGLFVTALNLLPIGQLDGGHIARAMFGTVRGQIVSSVAMTSLFLLAVFVWPGLFMWVLIVFFLAGRPIPPLNDLTPISPGRRVLGWITFLILLLIIAPLPQVLWSGMGIRCPYL